MESVAPSVLVPIPALSLKAARSKAKRLQSDIEDGDARADPAAKRQARIRAPTFNQLAEEWIERHGKPNKSPRALRDDQSMLNLHILPVLGSKKASEIAKRDISHR